MVSSISCSRWLRLLLGFPAIALAVAGCLDVPPPPVSEPDASSTTRDPPGQACAPGEYALPFQPTTIDRCAPEPRDALEVPDGWRFRIDTDELAIENESDPTDDVELPVHRIVPQAAGPELLVLSVEELRIGEGSGLYATGSRPLVLVASGPIDVRPGGLLSAAGADDIPGAGADDAICRAEGGRGGDGELQEFEDEPGGSGGGGGGFGAEGGAGAPVQASGGAPSAGGAPASGDFSPLRGGCSGGDGFSIGGDDSSGGGGGGGGGGALHIVAADTVTVRGAISASGGGGGGGDSYSGGGGGGSGGAVLIEAGFVTMSGALTANGGGGGQGMRHGSSSGACSVARDGANGSRFGNSPAEGGSSNCTPSGDGGDGGAVEPEGGDGNEGDSERDSGGDFGPAPAGGGGGGGGAGLLHVATCRGMQLESPTFSPSLSTSELSCDGERDAVLP